MVLLIFALNSINLVTYTCVTQQLVVLRPAGIMVVVVDIVQLAGISTESIAVVAASSFGSRIFVIAAFGIEFVATGVVIILFGFAFDHSVDFLYIIKTFGYLFVLPDNYFSNSWLGSIPHSEAGHL